MTLSVLILATMLAPTFATAAEKQAAALGNIMTLLPPPDQEATSGCNNGEYYVKDDSSWLKNETNALVEFQSNFQCFGNDCADYFGTTKTFIRDTQACLAGELEVKSGLDAKWKKGLFATAGAKYKTLMRFNAKNGPPYLRISLKIFGLGSFPGLPESLQFPAPDTETGTQDIIMEPTGTQAMSPQEQAESNNHGLINTLGFAGGVLKKFGIEGRRLSEKEQMISEMREDDFGSRKLASLSEAEFQLNVGAKVPNRYGTKSEPAVKFFMRTAAPLKVACKNESATGDAEKYKPCLGENGPVHTGLNALAAGSGGLVYELWAQLQGCKDPIEEGNVAWTSTEIAHIATLTLTKANDLATCTEFSYCSWHSIEAHRGLGSLNRARRPIYYAAHVSRNAKVAEESAIQWPAGNTSEVTSGAKVVLSPPAVFIAALVLGIL